MPPWCDQPPSRSSRTPRGLVGTAVAVALLIATPPFAGGQQPGDPFQFLAPSLVVSAADRERIDRDQVRARVLPGKNGQLAVFVATRLNAPPEALGAWMRAIAQLKRSEFVLAILLRGFFGAFARSVFEDRVARQAPLILRGLRARLESGNPPGEVCDPVPSPRSGAH